MLTEHQYSTKSVRAIKLLYFLLYVGMAAWSTQFYAFLERDRALTGVQIGFIAAVQQVNNLIVLPIWGMICDRYGKRRIFLVLLAIAALLIEGFLYTGSFWFYLGFIILFTSLYNPLAALVDTFALEKNNQSVVHSSYGAMRLWASFGWAVSSFGTGFLIKQLGLSFGVIFPVTTIFFVLSWIVAFFSISKKHEVKTSKSPSFRTLFELLLNNKKLLLFFLFCFVYYIFNAPILNMINIYYSEICAKYYPELSEVDLNARIGFIVGLAFALQSFCELPFMLYANKIVERFGTKKVIFFTLFVAALRMFLYGMSSNPWFSVVVGSLHGVTLGLFWAAAIGYVHSLVPVDQCSTGQMLFNTFLALGTCLGNLVTGTMKDTISLQSGMQMNALLIVLLILGGILVNRYLKFNGKM
ncbi:MAG: MFS transporter [Bacteroidales bacterium]|nr:MFS transporter [Bacteroidales bacterium]